MAVADPRETARVIAQFLSHDVISDSRGDK